MKLEISSSRSAVLFAAVCTPLFCLCAADPPATGTAQTPVLHAETRVVQVDVVVTNSRGVSVGDLTRDNFRVFDDGKPRAIDIFSVNRGQVNPSPGPSSQKPSAPTLPANVFSNRLAGPPNLPGHSTVIVLDQVNTIPTGSRTPFENAAYASLQAIKLMKEVKPDEQIALYVIARNRGLLVLQDYTTNRELLLDRLKKYIPFGMTTEKPPRPAKVKLGSSGGTNKENDPAESPRRDPNDTPVSEFEYMQQAVARDDRMTLQALAEHLALVPGRKSVFWVTEAFPPQLMHGLWQGSWDKTLAALNEANVAVNVVNSAGLGGGHGGTMAEIADRTGGQAFLARNDLDAAMAEGIEASRTTYTLAFYLPDNERDNKLHSIVVQTNPSDLLLHYRQGYYAGSTELPDSLWEKSAKGDLESSLLNQVDATAVGITARVDATPGHPRGTVSIRLSLDPDTLSLTEQGEGWTGKVEELLVELNDNGNTLTKVSVTKEFKVTKAGRSQYDSQGAAWPETLALMPGATRLKIVIRDAKSGRVGSLAVPIN